VEKPFTPEHFKKWARNLLLDTYEPWEVEPFQLAFVKDVFRGIVENWLVIPEGNAKTTLIAGLILYHIRFTKAAMVVVAASSRDQANWLYLAAQGFVERSPKIQSQFRCQEGTRRIRCDSMGSRIQVFAADDRTGDGANFTWAVLEELHRHRDFRLYRTWRGKATKRKGAQVIAISTAGVPGSEFEHTRARMKLMGKAVHRGAFTRAISKTTLIHDYAVPDSMDPDNMQHVKKANPLSSITIAQLQDKHDSPSFNPAHWRRFVCGMPAQLDGLVSPEEWDRLKVDIGGIQDEELVYVAVRVGQQGGCGIGIAAPREEGVAVTALQLPYDFLLLQGTLAELVKRYKVEAIYIDKRQFGMGADILEGSGLPLEDFPQSPTRLMEATATFLGLVSSKTVRHSGDEVLTDQVKLATAKETVTGAYVEASAEIQAFVATIVAAHQAMDTGAPTPKIHVYKGA
jgi:phage terminase large subunit-like protein